MREPSRVTTFQVLASKINDLLDTTVLYGIRDRAQSTYLHVAHGRDQNSKRGHRKLWRTEVKQKRFLRPLFHLLTHCRSAGHV